MGPETLAAAPTSAGLAPYLPRVCLEWLRDDPEARHRSLEGTLLFVDISGFTAMSERLAPKGRLGAEEVTDVMSATFTRLLAVAYANGGGLVKFGGDALLLFFDGDRHAARACNAAFGMRRTLDGIGSLQTSVGPVTLRMHVGAHAGRFDFFLVGESHRELILAGPEAAVTVAMEDAAEAGEILVSPAVAAELRPDDLGAEKGGGFLLARSPETASHGIAAVPDLTGLDLAACIPLALREHLQSARVEAEHRHAAVAFVRFSGVADVLAAEGPGAAAAAIEEAVVALQRAADSHGVCFLETDIDAAGGRAVLVAGVPTTAGDDEERLLRTARAAIEAESRLPLHIGVAAGNVFAGRVGPPYRTTFTILGGTAALAARLMAKAPERELWTTPDVLDRSRTLFSVRGLEPLALKGKSQLVDAVAVGAAGAVRHAPIKKLPLVDRQRELPVLEAALIPVKMGFGSFVELIGPAGIGKSRLVEEVCDRAGDVPVVATACEQYEATTPYFAFRKLIEAVLAIDVGTDPQSNAHALGDAVGRVDAELVPWTPLLGDVLDVPVASTRQVDELQASFRRARLHGVVEDLLSALLDQPTLLLFEDAHWMDEASADLLRHLGSRAPTKPWLMCATRRPGGGGFIAAEGVPPVPAMTLTLDPLPEDDAKALAASAAGGSIDADELAAITERAGGNPLFVRELVSADRAEGDALPESVEELVTTRIDSLSPVDRALLRWASVLGASFAGDLVAEVLTDDPDAAIDSESWDRLAEFVERDPHEPGVFRFRHALIRDAAYEGLSYRRRRELHARVGDVLREGAHDDGEVAELLSLHYMLAARPEEAWRYSLAAAERAKAKFANVEAAEFYRRALDASADLPALARSEIGRVWEALGEALELQGEYADAHGAFKSARRAFRGDAAALAGVYLKEGRLRENEGNYADALRWYTRGLQVLESADENVRPVHRLRLSLGYAAARFRQGALADCVQWCERVIEEARAAGALPELAHAYYLVHLAYTSLGSPERIRVRDLALPIYEELGDLLGQANALNNLGIDAYYEGRWDDALDYYERSRRARERIGDVVGAATVANNIAEILSDQGLLEQAEALLTQVYEKCNAAGSQLMTAVATANLGRAAARAGRHDDARRLLTQALEGLRKIEAGSFVLETEVRLAEAAVLAADYERALAEAHAAAQRTDVAAAPSVQALLHRVLAYAHVQAGELEDALAALERSLELARSGDALYEVALTLLARGRLRGDAKDIEEAQALLDSLHVVKVLEPPLQL